VFLSAFQAFHGFTPLSTQSRKELYMQMSERTPTYSEANWVCLDTLFLLVDAHLFAQLVEYKDQHPSEIRHSYEQVRRGVFVWLCLVGEVVQGRSGIGAGAVRGRFNIIRGWGESRKGWMERHHGVCVCVCASSCVQIYSHIRQCVDLCHRDGVIKVRHWLTRPARKSLDAACCIQTPDGINGRQLERFAAASKTGHQ
jgi:hypothetical protein